MFRLALPLCLLLAVCACNREPQRAPAIGEGFVGPISLNLREELVPGAKTVATVKHGDRLEILQTRRRFVKVRAESKAEGWVDARQLFSTSQMAELRELAARAGKLPSQGKATVYDVLNVHSTPSRYSPSFHQLREGEQVDLLDHRLSSRQPPPRPPAPKIAPPKKKAAKKPKKEPEIPPPPPGPPPKTPDNWLELSKSTLPDEPEPAEPAAAGAVTPEKPAAPAMEDWSLIRTAEKKAGWVLTRMLIMSIPDEVAQYAEGHRITSYFPLGSVQDRGENKNHWLWTTIEKGGQTYQFDRVRVFVWSTRRHRYETAFIERNLEGYFPTLVDLNGGPAFSVVVREKDGNLSRRKYLFNGYRVRLAGRESYERPPEPPATSGLPQAVMPAEEQAPGPPLGERLKNWVRGLWKRS